MADLVIPIREYIGESSYNWETDSYEWATNCDDLRWAIDYAGYTNQAFDRIVLEIGTCYGGSVDTGLEMFHYLQNLDVPVHTRILGTVASMGTIVPLAGDTIECSQTSRWMVHAPSNEFWGTAAEIAADLKGLNAGTAALAAVYTARTGADAATVAGWMSQDTWFTAAEALAAGLCTAVLPLRPKSAPAPTLNTTQATARRTRFAEAVARADKRTTPKPTTTPAAASAAASPSAPMATVVPKPTPRTAASAAKTAAKPAQARKTLFTQLKELFNGIDAEEQDGEAEAATDTAMAMESTELENGAFLYHDGALAVDTAVFEDEAMTIVPADGDYDTADGQVITVAGGIATAIAPDPATAATVVAPATATAQLTKRLDALEAKFGTSQAENATLKAENERLKAVKPPLPTPKARIAGKEAPDPKAEAARRAPATRDPFAS